MRCTIEAPCKINLHLKVGDKRPDGFHDLESIFAALAFSDSLSFEIVGKDGNLSFEMSGGIIPQEKNLVCRAVSLFREKTGFDKGLRIHLYKRIPVGAGLGGGSSDAASSLLALNFLSGSAFSKEELLEMAVVLGSDVPFFLSGGAAWVSGRGEIIEPIETAQGLWVVLAKPSFSSDTAYAYKLLDQARALEEREKRTEERLAKKVLVRALAENPKTWPFSNDFLPIFLSSIINAENNTAAAAYMAILEKFNKLGASFTGLSGSGSCCFGVFKDRKEAENAEISLKTLNGYQIFTQLTFFLASLAIPVLQ
ncbi:MAG: 4-(cytidine 5'-diphospho)-2-C-methyl-D-erythritol kinase [Treponema sp.]|jgi:4-diphosphocytidyl-2-C-methyl-D-erythritol kinase|nr:4-(cytidine 5'-diphospho)-2-C-methyl-D-erythritol kinase [Treponema sp.]